MSTENTYVNPLDRFLDSGSDASNLEASAQEELQSRFAKWWEDFKITYQRQQREAVLLSIKGVKREDNQTFTLENLEYPHTSHIVDVKEILDCSDAVFLDTYLQEFKDTERENAIYEHLNNL